MGLRLRAGGDKAQEVSQKEPNYGEPPDTDAIAELLAERYPLKKEERLAVDATARETMPGLTLTLTSGRNVYTIEVEYRRGAGDREVWMVVTDALDALFGTFMENGRAHRDLPIGSDVEYEGAFFRVEATREVPDLSDKADQLLNPRKS